MNTLHQLVIDIERTKLLKTLDYQSDGSVYEGEIEALFQSMVRVLQQLSTSKTP
jgi:hypothetical protein